MIKKIEIIFIDSDAFIALHHSKDLHHVKAKELQKNIEDNDYQLITSWDVIDEVSTKLSFFGTRQKAINFLEQVTSSKVTIVLPDNRILKDSIKVFKKQSSKKVSFTDCVNMAIAKQRNIDAFFSFDQHYVKNGFKLLA